MIARWLHPCAWWLWSLSLAAGASQTTNPLLLALLICSAVIVVASRKPQAPWGKSFNFFLLLGAMIITIRVLFQLIFGAGMGTTILIELPGISLPDWMNGLRIGGSVTLEALLGAFYDGLRIATIAIVVGAANSLASPTRLLKAIPTAFYELGVSIVVALTFIPQLTADAERIRGMRRLRGKNTKGVRGFASLGLPVLAGALDRSIILAESMDSRGYGRHRAETTVGRRISIGLVLTSLSLAIIGTYALLTASVSAMTAFLILGTGVLLGGVTLWRAGLTRVRTVYRPDTWALPEYLVSAAGVCVLGIFLIAHSQVSQALVLTPELNNWPVLPLWGLIAFTVACTPALSSPRPPDLNSDVDAELRVEVRT
ncbi:MAG: energy-coupling factor transporter transmembrane component T [Candidatus Nanopelagicales bacterium]|nr:energy-coupling factor transporter transmembrane component T [Candidatus Nanopelagicales bacterium]